jgi:hypothetical protein
MMKFPQYVSTNERTVSVVNMINKDDDNEKAKGVYIDGKGYIDEDEHIWIYCGAGKPKNPNEYPYFWINEEGKKEFSNPSEVMRKAFSVTNMKDMSLLSIINNTNENEELFDEEAISDMNTAAAFYVPRINESDDFLKRTIKTIIIKKGVDINKLKSKTGEKYILPNMKAALENSTKMSVKYFCQWIELLGCDFELTIFDSGDDKVDPLRTPEVYSSRTNKMYDSVNGELIESNTGNISSEEDDEDVK